MHYRKSCRLVVPTQMKIDAFLCLSRSSDGKEKMSSAASDQGIVHNNEVRAPDLHAEASATIRQTPRQATLQAFTRARILSHLALQCDDG